MTTAISEAQSYDIRMTSLTRRLMCVVALLALVAGPVSAVQRGWMREAVRTSDINRVIDSCGPLTGLKEIVEHTQWTVEGTIVRADAALHESDRQEFLYTDYILDVTRVFRFPAVSDALDAGGDDVVALPSQ